MKLQPPRGKAWVFGDDVNTDSLAPGLYMKGPFEELARHCLESLDPSFAREVIRGDIVVAGDNFGIGSSREQAAEALKHLGVSCVVAHSFGGIFHRNALNLGLLAITCTETKRIRPGDLVCVDAASGYVDNLSSGDRYECHRLPPQLLTMVADGGLIPHLKNRAAAECR